MENKQSYDELKRKCNDFQAQIIRLLKVEQDLVDARSKMARDLSRFKSIQTYSQRVVNAASLEDFANITVESVVETFEVECSSMFIYDKTRKILAIQASYGQDEEVTAASQIGNEWISAKGFFKKGKVIIEEVQPGSVPFGNTGLFKVILSPYYDEEGALHGMLTGGVTTENKAYYDKISEELKPSFMVFTQQMNSMLQNFEARKFLDLKVQERTAQVIHQKKEIEEINTELNSQKDELLKTLQDLRQAQSQLVQSEKMASLGQLVAGIAHEINNPVNFISAGVDSLVANLEDIRQVLDIYHKVTADNVVKKLKEIQEIKEKVKYKEAIREISKLIGSIKNGTKRTTEIVRGLLTFSRLDEDILKTADIHEGLDSTLMLLHNRYKGRIEIIKNYGKLPPFECYPGQLNQVFMNILSNAVDSIEDRGTITISTAISGNEFIRISIKDTGHGIPQKIMEKIFDPFYTTKDVGKGTGLGLSISQTIVEKHRGRIEVKSEGGKGSEFIILLPLKQAE
jgi:signal transduction histidine kinase